MEYRDHKGKPSDANKGQSGTGIPTRMEPGHEQSGRQAAEKYTQDDENIAGSVRVNHPNRNTDKDDATNAGGYRQ